MKAQPITPERILEELRVARHVDAVSIPLKGNKFVQYLENREFACGAKRIINEKLQAIRTGEIKYARGGARVQTTQGWRNALEMIDKKLQESPGELLGR